MISLHGIWAKGHAVYKKKVELELHPGLTVIRGRNKNVRVKASNFVGKSVLTGILPLVVYEQPSLSTSKRYSSMDVAKTAELGVFVDKYEIQRHGSKFKVLKNGTDINCRTKAIAREKIAKIWPFTEEEFYSHIYIDSARSQTFIRGTPSTRFDFFTSLFRLDSYDSVRDYFRTLMKDIQADASLLKAVEQEVVDLEKSLEGVDYDKLKRQVKKYRREQEVLSSKQRRVFEQISKLKVQIEKAHVVREVKRLLGEVPFDRLESRVQRLTKELKEAEAWELWKEESLEAGKHRARLKKQLNEELHARYGLDVDKAKSVLHRAGEVEEKRKTLLSKKRQLEEESQPPTEKELEEAERGEKLNLKKLERIKEKTNKALFVRQKMLKLIDHTHEGGDKCPVCKSSMKDAESLRTNLRSEIETLERKSRLCDIGFRCIATAERVRDYKHTLREIKSVKKQLNELPDRVDVGELKEFISVATELKAWKAPEEPERPKSSTKDIKPRLSRLKECWTLVQTHSIKSLEASDVDQLRAEVKVNRRKDRELSKRLMKVASRLPELKSRVSLHKAHSASLTEKKEQLIRLKKSAKDLPALQLLVDTYSTNGLKMLAIKRIAERIQRNLNAYAPLLFPEPVGFTIEVGKGTFSVFIHSKQRTSKVKQLREIRVLSGAEGRAFTMLFLLAVLPMIPSSRRCDTLILDEPSVNFDEAMSENFRTRFLPSLLKVVPKIVVVTPLAEEYPGARVMTVVRKGKESHLEHGVVR